MSGPPSHGAAQDLSFADQQELLAFIEKRNWFEQKLDSLKALAPVYPFVHPHLVADPKSTAGYVRAGADTSPWRLPDRAQLSAWVSERNALEDEVARFDDGDMDRMKEKTRQMTRVPLTQPSTDLVEVTLDLILLIDQLLTVLRRRGAVLELTSLRLQWDDLRYEVSRESESVNAEIQHVVAEAQAWIPGMPAPERPERIERRTSTKLLARPPLDSSPSTSSLTDSGVAVTPSSPPSSPGKPPPSPSAARKVPPSPTKQTGGPKSSLHLSILRSQLVGLQSRQRNFSITLVKRSSTILDKMIDAAGRLDGLGGINGPLEEGTKAKGAVPEELIELQEAIEENASCMNDRVKWCGEFETQCRQAHQHYTASLHAQHIAGEVLVALEKALTTPASSEQHAALAKQYAEATKILPPPIDATFPRPSHPDYPSKDLHNERLVDALNATREAARADVDLAGKGLAFYGGMVKAREALLAQHQRVQTLRTQLNQTMEQLERGTASVPRPNLETVAQIGGDCSEWLQRAAVWISTGNEVVRSAHDTHQSTTLAAMQYEKSLKSYPLNVKKYLPERGVPDDLGPIVADDASDLIALANRCAALTKTTTVASEAIPLVLRIRQDSEDVTDDVATLQDNVVLAINNTAWSSRTSDDWPAPDFSDDIARLNERAVDLDRDMQRLKGMTNSSAVSQPLFQKVADVHGKISESRRKLETLARVSDQARVVLAVQTEAETLLADLTMARESIPSDKDTRAVNLSVTALRQRVATWNDTLTQRAVFVSNDPPTLDRSTSHERSDGGPLTPPLTPVEGSSATGTTMPDLVALDGRVRSELNRQSARVASALANLITTAEQVAFESWAEPVIKATTTLEGATDKLGVVMTDLANTMEKVKAAEGEERKTLATQAQKTARETLPEPVIHVQQCIAALNTALGDSSAANVDMRHAAEVFSSADVAREAGLARITETEEWQKEVTRLVLESDVKLAKQKAQLLKQKAAPLSGKTEPHSASTTQETARELVDKLNALDLESVVRPSPIVLRTTPKARRLPSSAVAKKLTSTFSSIKDSARALDSNKKSGEVDTLFNKLKRASTLVPELDGLGAVSDAAAACDKAFSTLLDAIDAGSKDKIKAAERKAETTVVAFKKAAAPYRLDQRVVKEQKRIVLAWDDLRSLAHDEPLKTSTSTAGSVGSSTSRATPASRTSTLSRSSTTPSLSSLLSDSTVVAPPKKGKALARTKPLKPTRNLAMPPPELPLPKKPEAPESRPRVASAGDTSNKPPKIKTTPALKRQPTIEKRSSSESVKSVKDTPRIRPRASGSFTTPSSSKLKPTIPQPFNLSGTPGGLTRSSSATTSLSEMATPARNRGPRLSAPPRTPIVTPTPKLRRPTRATKLDEAVAQVLDDLEVDVPVVPVGRDSPEQWHDESGRYWIGTGAKARLCYCRILRSRTVMVRVGGGWVELSRFLMDRFADTLAEQLPTRETMSMSPPDWRRIPLAITSATLAAGLSSVRSDGSLPRTPARKPLPPFDASPLGGGNSVDPITPDRMASLSPTSQPSPLVPLSFIRKASESPSVREKEREQLRHRPSFMREGSAGSVGP